MSNPDILIFYICCVLAGTVTIIWTYNDLKIYADAIQIFLGTLTGLLAIIQIFLRRFGK
ncbi:MAG: hypothetical protein KBF99_13650 [Leptospiraceae bacterium]|jgi:hypothetical protein|nr:hypothetical protein [Leptospiraceae bacterium]MBK7056035.1 hypothetical protein [Leptospiraceae bacterium]MBK9498056.1 hypothetical protein [Leptospiraceae bacterium]MBP9164222.1 hypothetical protein [Leptospiraceae bacterium]